MINDKILKYMNNREEKKQLNNDEKINELIDDRLRNYIKEKNGKILDIYKKGEFKRVVVECDKGHVWDADRRNLVNKHQWCSKCSGVIANKNRLIGIEPIKKIIKDRGGKLARDFTYENTYTMFDVICQHGHTWSTNYDRLKKKNWCPECKISYGESFSRSVFETLTGEKFVKIKPKWLVYPANNTLLELDGYCEIINVAFEYNGVQHYEQNFFVNSEDKLLDRLEKDKHKIKTCLDRGVKLCSISYELTDEEVFNYIKQFLINNNIKINEKITFKDIKIDEYTSTKEYENFLESIGYKPLTQYTRAKQKITVKCPNGHEWTTQARAIKEGNRCPYCSKRVKYDLKYIEDKARENGFICLEDEYINVRVSMGFKCVKCGNVRGYRATDMINKVQCKCTQKATKTQNI